MVIPAFNLKLPRIVFGHQAIKSLPVEIEKRGQNVLLVTGARSFTNSKAGQELLRELQRRFNRVATYAVSSEPSPEMVDNAADQYRKANIQVVVAVGGGSTLDTGKAIAAMLKLTGNVEDYPEGVGTKHPDGAKVPFIAVPTTAGTGTEATKNAVISRVGAKGYKKSLRHDHYLPDLALVDPDLTLSCPALVTAASGLDAFTQLLESYVSVKAFPVTDALARNGMEQVSTCLVPACTDGAKDPSVRAGMSYAALVSGITLAHAGLGVVHGIASICGGLYSVPHGLVCGSLLGPATAVTIAKLRAAGDKGTSSLRKYAQAGYLVSGKTGSNWQEGCRLLMEKIQTWTHQLNIPNIEKVGIPANDFPRIAEQTGAKNNPGDLNQGDILDILHYTERL